MLLFSGTSVQPKDSTITGFISATAGEVVKGSVRGANDVMVDKIYTFACPILWMLEAALPLQYRPALKAVARENWLKMPLKSTCPSPSERNRPARSVQLW